MLKRIYIICILLILIILNNCQTSNEKNGIVHEDNASSALTSEEIKTSAAAEESTADNAQPAIINPLTGLPSADAALLERKPVMVKVSNYPQAGRPHAGLSFADMVFDYYIGSGTNRFLALYYGQDSPKIGPLRSGRRVDVQLVTLYEGILAYGSADEDTDAILVQALGERAISYLEAPYPAFDGTDTHSVVGVFANSAAISQFAKENGIDDGSAPSLPGMVFSQEVPQDGKPAENVLILFNYYNRGEWRYDATSRQYLRWIEEVDEENPEEFTMIPLVDRVTNQQLAFDNILVLFAEYIEYAPSVHDVMVSSNTQGEQAVFFRNGQCFQGSWKIASDSDPIQFFDQLGNPFVLKPGKTWILLVGKASLFYQNAPGYWEIFFNLP